MSSVTDAPTVVPVLGVVPARPESRLPTPSTVIAPCTARKSTARGRRQETRWIATAPLMVRMEALNGAASAGLPSGTAASRSNTAGITVTGISMMTVPETVGVSTRWNSESRADSMSGTKDETTTRVASSAGPPVETAAMQTAMKAPEAPITTR